MKVCDKCKKRKVEQVLWIGKEDAKGWMGEERIELCEVCSKRIKRWLDKPETLFEQLFKLE